MATLVVLVVLAAVVTVVSFARAISRSSHLEPGPEREASLNSLWSLGGSAGIILSIAMSIPPFSLPLTPRVGILGGAVVLALIGGIKNRRLAAARQHALLQAGVSAATLAEQLDALEGQRLQYRKAPLRFAVVLTGGKAIAAGTAVSVMRFIRDPTFLVLVGAFAVLNTAWLAWDVLSAIRRKAGRDRIDEQIAALLGTGRSPLPGTGGPWEEP